MFKTIEWTGRGVVMLDQRRLPEEEVYVTLGSAYEVAEAIRDMTIRGAPAIGVAAAMGLALGITGNERTQFYPVNSPVPTFSVGQRDGLAVVAGAQRLQDRDGDVAAHVVAGAIHEKEIATARMGGAVEVRK